MLLIYLALTRLTIPWCLVARLKVHSFMSTSLCSKSIAYITSVTGKLNTVPERARILLLVLSFPVSFFPILLGLFFKKLINSTALQDVQGNIEYYVLSWNTSGHDNTRKIPPSENLAVIGELQPNTEYWISLQVFNGVHSITSEVVHVSTSDGGRFSTGCSLA